ncbi:hypothetical protein KP509_06G075300 [Ceratopteris richardii]|uniref:Uncharacterized protein n=1 Tax=Ceratopteris richardii TaxID=49495 RepID=A0A8T2UP79_CERRI|nr:hypothetical protein KP509_06G075300 [Ceratopteris richardii]
MPLLKRRPYNLCGPPNDLKPKDYVFQVRFTKEIFKNYEDYLEHVKLYKKPVWGCKFTGKNDLTYEEALESERKAAETVQQFPNEFMGPVLKLVQFSMLRNEDLINVILNAFTTQFVPGEELLCAKENSTKPCKVLQVLKGEHPNESYSYEVEFMDTEGTVIGTSIESTNSLVRKKAPFTRAMLSSFIRESVKGNTDRNTQAPLMVHEKLCERFDISTTPPAEVQNFLKHESCEINFMESEVQPVKKPKKIEADLEKQNVKYKEEEKESKKRKVLGTKSNNQANKRQKSIEIMLLQEGAVLSSENGKTKKRTEPIVKVKPINYPIEDTLLQPSQSELSLGERPPWSSDFVLPMHCIGPLLMIWNFFSLFARVIRLSHFSLEQFEMSLKCSKVDPTLLKEAHYALIKVILDDPPTLEAFQKRRQGNMKVTIWTWREDLAALLQLHGFEQVAMYSSAVNKGNYGRLEPSIKLDILSHLVEHTLNSVAIRKQLDAYIEQKQVIISEKRREELEKSKKEKEAQDFLKQQNTAVIITETISTTEDKFSGQSRKELRDFEKVEKVGEVLKKPGSGGVICEPDFASQKQKATKNDKCGFLEDTCIGESSSEMLLDGIAKGTPKNCACKETVSLGSTKLRQIALKLKAEIKQAENIEKEKKRMDEQRKQQELRKIRQEAAKERKLQEKRIIESQRKDAFL